MWKGFLLTPQERVQLILSTFLTPDHSALIEFAFGKLCPSGLLCTSARHHFLPHLLAGAPFRPQDLCDQVVDS